MIELAGGMDFLGLPGEPSREADWDEVRAAEPNTVILMQCGYDAARSAEEAEDFAEELSSLGAERDLRDRRQRLLQPPRTAAGRRHRAARAHAPPHARSRAGGRRDDSAGSLSAEPSADELRVLVARDHDARGVEHHDAQRRRSSSCRSSGACRARRAARDARRA